MKKAASVLIAVLSSLMLISCVDKNTDNDGQVKATTKSAEKVSSVTTENTVKSDYGTAQNPIVLGKIGIEFYIQNLVEDKALYCAPDESSEPVLIIPAGNDVSIIDFEGDYAYCSIGTYFGWIKGLIPDGNSRHIPMPEFFDEELKSKYIQAQTLFNAYSSNVAGLKGFADKERHVWLEQSGMDIFEDSLYCTEGEIFNALKNVFTEEYIDQEFLVSRITPDFVTQDSNGQVLFPSYDRGSWVAKVIDYRLIEKTDDRIEFEVHYRFGEENAGDGNVKCIALKDDKHGWIFSQFTTDKDDTRWMNAMGDDFDPWEAMANG